MKVYLLNPPYYPHFGRGMRWQDVGRAGTLYYPIWLSYATGVVEEEYETRLVDAVAWNWNRKDVVKDILKFQPDLLVMDSSFPSLDNDISVAETIKENCPELRIVLVGSPASQFPDKILESKGIDFVARWEYDLSVKEIAEAVEKDRGFEQLRGISYKRRGKIVHNPDRGFTESKDLDGIPFVSRVYKKHLNIRDYFLSSSLYPEVQIFTGRGCPFLCTFCSWPQTLMGRKYRVRSIPNVLDELEWIQENLPEVKEVFFEDDTFTIDRKRVTLFVDGYKERGLDIVWACNARVGLDYETMRKMKKSGCRLVIVGYESGSNEILKNVKKGITIDEIKKFAKDAKKAGLLVHADFIVGLPGETKETIEQTRGLIKHVRPEILQVSVATPFPGTEFYLRAEANGGVLMAKPNDYLDNQGHQKAMISYPELSHEEIAKAVDKILRWYYTSPTYLPITFRQIFRRHGWNELKRIIRSSRAFMNYLLSR